MKSLSMTTRPVLALLLAAPLGLTACAAPPAAPVASRAGVPNAGGDAARSDRAAACMADAERVVRFRDRGQLMRQDDYNARIGTTSYLGPQVISDQFAQVYDRDRMAADCVRGANSPTATPRPAPTPAPGTPTRR
ncbi:hypothetical protein [Roseomonas indoligenes]|uniref:Lipoprotein n=1 Tax=Roseomonas indoligenes TaxID=2820811 RepID=A0A940N2B0_9PROT|nr:hypothetical protein [Pararoseomonas indoligenes]MBP0492922.1 hypothetical protein [Pararoseomonas indoligenes]